MSQFHHTQHGGDSDFQMWQQQQMYKQLQEFQRQQHVQQLDHGARMQTSFGQFQASAKAVPADQLPAISNETPNNESAPYAWSHNFASGDPRLSSNPQMLNASSNTNWEQYGGAPGTGNFINGSVFPNTQSQPMRPMGLATHQMNHSFYPIPATSRGGSGNQYPQFLGIPADLQNAMTRAGTHQSEKASRPFSSLMDEPGSQEKGASSSMQNFPGKGGFFSNSSLQSQGASTKAGSPVPVNHLRHGFQLQDFHGRPNQVDFQMGMQEKSTMQVGPASGGASLDPTEEKFLFGDDEDSNWGALLKGDNDHGNSLDNNNFGGALPSLHSGSWSALMQETLQSTTSNNSPKEEWSGLGVHKTEQAIANNSTLPGRDQSKLVALSATNLHNAQPSSASSYADGSMNNPDFASFQHATRTPYEQRDKAPHESSRATATDHQSAAEVNNGYIQQSMKQKQSEEYGRQDQVHLSNGNWAHQKSEMPRNNSHSTGAPSSAHGFWMSQQNAVDRNINQESSNSQNDWKINSPLGQDISSSNQNVFNSDGNFWKLSGGNANLAHRLQQMKPDVQIPKDSSDGKGVSMMGSSMPAINPNQHQMVIGRTGEHVGINHNISRRGSETSESLRRSAEPRPNDGSQEYQTAIHTERQGSILNHGQHVSSDLAARRHSFFAGKESQSLGQSSQQTTGSYMLQNHAMDNTGVNIRHSPGNPVSNNQFPPQSLQAQNNMKPRFITNSQVAGNMASVNEKMLAGDEHFKSRHGVPNSSSVSPYGGSDAGLSQNRAVQNSQHMLQLLHKVDNSTNSNAAADVPSSSLDNVATSQQQFSQSSLQGFGLRLAPPSQRQSTSDNLWSSQGNVDGKLAEHSARGDHQLPSAASQYLSPALPSSQPTPFHSSEMGTAGQPAGHFPQLTPGQQYPVPDARSGSVSMPQQGSSATVFKNVWTNISAQRLAGIQSNKITPNILQSMMFSNNASDSNLWGSKKADDQGQKASTPSDAATSSANSHSQETKQAVDSDAGLTSSEIANFDSTGATVSRGNQPLQKHSSDVNFAIPASSLAQLRQQGIMNPRQGENPAANFQVMNTHSAGTNGSGIGLHGSPIPSNITQQNFSLLHQMQALGHVDIDPNNTTGKMLKQTESGSDASHIDWKSAQRFAHGANNSVKSSIDNINGASVQGSFPSDMKMLSFAPRNNEERSTSIPSQIPSRELPSHGMVARNDHQSQVQSLGTNAASNLIERSERPGINPQIAPSWFNAQNRSVFNAQKNLTPPHHVPKASWCMENNSPEHRADSGQSVRPSVPSSMKAAMVRRPKKRKYTEYALVSWHKITEGTQKLRKMSTNEMDWAWAANRLIKKAEDDLESLEDVPVHYLPRKRLIMTTRLIQEVFPAIPATVLRAQAISAYESATFNIAMVTLRDSCIISSDNSRALADNENNPSEQRTSAKQMEDKFSKVVEVFAGRIRKMENDYLSLNMRASMLDMHLECQDLERISIVNRLGRFHGRNHAAGVDPSSVSQMVPRRIFPDRHVMSFAVPGNLPEGAFCLSL